MPIRRRGLVTTAAIVMTLMLTGCVSDLVLETTKELSVQVTDLNGKVAAYQRLLEGDASRRIGRIANTRTRTASLRTELDQRLAVWELARFKEALRLYAGVQSLAVDALAARSATGQLARETSQLRASQARFRSQQKVLADFARQLAAMSKPPELKEQAKFLYEFGRQTSEALEKAQAAADEQPPN